MEGMGDASTQFSEGDPPRVLLQSLVRQDELEGLDAMDVDQQQTGALFSSAQQPRGQPHYRTGSGRVAPVDTHAHAFCPTRPSQHEQRSGLIASGSGAASSVEARPNGGAAGPMSGAGTQSRPDAPPCQGGLIAGPGCPYREAQAVTPPSAELGAAGCGSSGSAPSASAPPEVAGASRAAFGAAGAPDTDAVPRSTSGIADLPCDLAASAAAMSAAAGAADDGRFVGPPPLPPDSSGADDGVADMHNCSAPAAVAAAEGYPDWRMAGEPRAEAAQPAGSSEMPAGLLRLTLGHVRLMDAAGLAPMGDTLPPPCWQRPPRPPLPPSSAAHVTAQLPQWCGGQGAGAAGAATTGRRASQGAAASASAGSIGATGNGAAAARNNLDGYESGDDGYADGGLGGEDYSFGTNLLAYGGDEDSDDEADAATASVAAAAPAGGNADAVAAAPAVAAAAAQGPQPIVMDMDAAGSEDDSDDDGAAAATVRPLHEPYSHLRGCGSRQRRFAHAYLPFRGPPMTRMTPEAAGRAGGSAGSYGGLAGAGAGGGASTSAAGAAGPGDAWRALLQPACRPEQVTTDTWSDDEEEEADTTAEQFYAAEHPKDIQGIPWDRLQFNRSTYRDTRLRQYRNYTNVLPDDDGGAYRADLAPLCAAPRRGGTAGAAAGAVGPPFFSFVRNSRAVQSNIVHFQLRNLVWALSPNDVFVVHENCVNHWNPAARTVSEVLNLNGSGGNVDSGGGGGGGPRGGRGGASSRLMGLGRVQVSTLCVSGDLVAAGGFMGELVVRRLRGEETQQQQAGKAGGGGGLAGKLLHCGRITSSENGITNGLEIFSHASHGTVVMAANNDSQLRLFAAAGGEGSLRPLAAWPFDWAVNYATVRPGGGGGGGGPLAAVVGDDPATLLTDVHNGVTVARLQGHRDFSFAAAWHPGGNLLATGNQDTTALVWDVRRTDVPLTRLAGRMGAIRSLRFSPDGRFLAMSEPADFVHLYDVASGFLHCQEHDFFGEIAGVSFTPDSGTLFVGVSDLTYASLMQLERQRCDWW